MAKQEDAKANGKKRKFAKHPHGQAQKRRKGNSVSKGSLPTARPRRVVAANDLKWKPVAIPEMFDDAEGFFGLEEIEGVDVVRNGDTVQFVTTDPLTEDSEEFEGFDDVPASNAGQATAESEEEQADGDKPGRKAKRGKETRAATETGEQLTADTEPKNKADKKKKGKDGKGEKDSAADEALSNGGGFSMLAEVGSDVEADDEADVSAWVPLDLSPPILSCLARLKFGRPTAIQSASIPEILAGHDVIGKASTGSGKTLAFSIPIVQTWLSRNRSFEGTKKSDAKKTPLALILSPTRELAHQITNHIKDLCAALPTSPYVCSVTGGLSVHKQQRQLEKADIVVGTPGRLWEVLSSSTPLLEAFRSISFLVVDEADRLLSEGHFKEAEEILLALDRVEIDEEGDDGSDEPLQTQRPRQTLVFSATFNKGLQQKLAGKGRYDLMDQAQSMEHLLKRLNFREEMPKFIDVNPVSQMADRLREGLVECGAMEKDLYLYALLLLQPTRRTLVFTNSISSVRRLTPMLQNLNMPALPLHSQMPQKARLRSVERFTAAQNDRGAVLIATDVAARGLDIPGIDVVIHYHVPRTADNYVHRSGRTARAENAGLSILLCAPEEVIPTRRLVAKIHAAASTKDAAADKKSGKSATAFFIRSIDLDRRLVSRLRDRLMLAKQLADSSLAKEKGNKDANWLREAAEELGVDYDSEDGGVERAGSWSGRGSGRRNKEKQARELTKTEAAALRAQLKQLLAKRVNAGVSERYLTAGGVDVEELLRGSRGEFLGSVDGLGLDDD